MSATSMDDVNAAASRQMKLAVFASAGPVSGSHGGWRHPEASGDLLSAAYYQDLGGLLEEGRFDLLFLADILAVPDRLRDSLDSQLRYGALGALRLDPLVVLGLIAGATKHVGLACTVSTTYFEPFTVARSMATLDHLSNGRAAWNIVTSFQQAEARNFGSDDQLSHDQRYDRADEFMEVACALWDSWQDDALVRDRNIPLFADPSRVRRVDHDGKWLKVRGPLNVSRSPQGRPVFVQAGASHRGRDFAARWAEVVFVTHSVPEPAREFRLICGRGRRAWAAIPTTSKSCPVWYRSSAKRRRRPSTCAACWKSLSHPEAGLSTLSYHLGVDLSRLPQDQVLPETLHVPGVEGHYREVAELTRRTGMSVATLGQQDGAGRTARGFAGTAHDVADRMQEWWEAGACDGFMLQIPYFPGGLERVVRLLVPELQRRRLFRTEYTGTTLRDHLGLARPPA